MMTFELLEKIIQDNHIRKDVELLNDSENDLCTTDMDCVQYCVARNEICFKQGGDLSKPDHAQNDDWIILWHGQENKNS